MPEQSLNTESQDILKSVVQLLQLVICLIAVWLLRKLKNAFAEAKQTSQESISSPQDYCVDCQCLSRSKEGNGQGQTQQKGQELRLSSSAPALICPTSEWKN
jgi:hypothetical protein